MGTLPFSPVFELAPLAFPPLAVLLPAPGLTAVAPALPEPAPPSELALLLVLPLPLPVPSLFPDADEPEAAEVGAACPVAADVGIAVGEFAEVSCALVLLPLEAVPAGSDFVLPSAAEDFVLGPEDATAEEAGSGCALYVRPVRTAELYRNGAEDSRNCARYQDTTRTQRGSGRARVAGWV